MTAAPTPVPRDYIRSARDAGSEPVIELLVDRLVDYKALVDRVDPDWSARCDQPGLDRHDERGDRTRVSIRPSLPPAPAAAGW